jgi:hypothetical protein
MVAAAAMRMTLDLPLRRCCLALVIATACASPPDPYRYVGTWTFEPGSAVEVTCPGAEAIPAPIAGTVVKLTETASGIELDLGCRCRLQLSGDGTLAGAGQPCAVTVEPSGTRFRVAASIDGWTTIADPSDATVLRGSGQGTATPTQIDGALAPTCRFTLQGQLKKTDVLRPHCGDERTAVGVFRRGVCPLGAGTDDVTIAMANDPSTGCAAVLGDSGEPAWLPPQALKRSPACVPNSTSRERATTRLTFCRVDGQLFKPFPGDGTPGSSYALLQLGERCPHGSVSVAKSINNDDELRRNGFLGEIKPNQSSNGGQTGTLTKLFFCLFPPAEEAVSETLSAFPELGFLYGVFHDFEGFQPSWVLAKHWLRSDDESSTEHNAYFGPDGVSSEGAFVEGLKEMIDDLGNDTTFDVARVR